MTATTALPRPRPARLSATASRRVPFVALGVVLVVGGALAAGLVVQSASQRSAVVVAATDLGPGHRITAADLRVVEVALDGPAAVVPATRLDQVVGRTAVAAIPAGSLLAPGDVADDAGPGAGRVVVGTQLGPGGLPVPDLRPGDWVGLVAVGDGGTDVALGQAEVFRISPGAQPGTQFVSLAVADVEALRATGAAAAGRLRLVLLPGRESGR